MTPRAYSFYQDFAPAPAATFQTDRHYLLYAASGAMRLTAALIAADHPITVSLPQKMTVCSVLFAPDFTAPPPAPLTVFDMTPLARALILETKHWGQDAGPLTPLATQIFRTLAAVAWALCETPSRAVMPAPQNPVLIRALALTEASLDAPPDFETLARDVGQSPRSLARAFATDLGMTWRQCLRQLRMIRAIEQLAASDGPIVDVAFAVGYSALSAFNAAFLEFTGQTPSAYRASFRA
jgi:AraC-like DNA-binding protein